MSSTWRIFSWMMIAVAAVLGLLLIFGCNPQSTVTEQLPKFAILPVCPAAGLFPNPKPRKRKKRSALNTRP